MSGDGENPVCNTLEECAVRKATLYCDFLDQDDPALCRGLFQQLREQKIRPDEIYQKLVKEYGADAVEAAKAAVAERLRVGDASKKPTDEDAIDSAIASAGE